MRITRLPRGNAQFPTEKDPGDIVMLSNGDSFVWSKAIWNLIGGRYLKPEVREWMLDYLKEDWPTAPSSCPTSRTSPQTPRCC